MQRLNYNDKLKQLGLMKLEGRRTRSDLVETFKIANGECDISTELFFQLDKGDRRGHDQNCLRKDLDWMLRKMFILIPFRQL